MKFLKIFIFLLFSLKAFGVEVKLYSIANAKLTLYQIDKKGFHKIWQDFSKGDKSLKDIGSFEINSSLIKKDKFYLLSAKGGKSFDVDIDIKTDDFSNKQIKIKKGDKLTCEVYLQEGECAYLLNSNEVDFECLEYDKSFYKKIQKSFFKEELWLKLKYKEEYEVYIKPKDMLKFPNVKEGKIRGYGEISS